MQQIPLIQKEALKSVNFQKTDVIQIQALRLNRYNNLNRALILGNLYHPKVSIIFKTGDGSLQKVVTTIWAVSDDFILLKGGIFVPVKAILELEF